MRRVAAVLGLVLAGAPCASEAQSAIRGSIRVDSTSRPVVGAEITLEGVAGAATTTNSSGDFLLGGLGAIQGTLVFRAIGFRPFRAPVILSGSDTVEVDVRLTPLIQQLATLEIEIPRERRISGKMEDFERRRKTGFGRFFTRAELATMETGPMSIALRHAAGLRLVVLPNTCGNGFGLAAGRRTSIPIPLSMYCAGFQPPEACYVDVYLDGALFWRWGILPPLDIDQLAVRDYQAIEIYRGRAELPIEFSKAEPACGAIVLWTRTGEP